MGGRGVSENLKGTWCRKFSEKLPLACSQFYFIFYGSLFDYIHHRFIISIFKEAAKVRRNFHIWTFEHIFLSGPPCPSFSTFYTSFFVVRITNSLIVPLVPVNFLMAATRSRQYVCKFEILCKVFSFIISNSGMIQFTFNCFTFLSQESAHSG